MTISDDNDENSMQLSDRLALQRTDLANERTLLAYVRTAVGLAAGGAVLIRFFPESPALIGFGWLSVVAGAATAVIGTYRFFAVRGRLRK